MKSLVLCLVLLVANATDAHADTKTREAPESSRVRLHFITGTGLVAAGNAQGLPFGLSVSWQVGDFFHVEAGAHVIFEIFQHSSSALFLRGGTSWLFADGRNREGIGWEARIPILARLGAYGSGAECDDDVCDSSSSFTGLSVETGFELRHNGNFSVRILGAYGRVIADYGDTPLSEDSQDIVGFTLGMGLAL
jgi:hypothetical protein